ncbi:MAG: DNA repair exonuclease [Dehalococcoidales bacterium]|nr:DNA repair exonuclease [Dehalococcoidales bacterium]
MAESKRTRRRLLHTSDLHLVSIDDGDCSNLEATVNLAIRLDVDLVIIAGDLFDRSRVDDSLVVFVVEQLRRLSAPVLILPGNHDCLTPNSVYERDELWANCSNTRIFRSPLGEVIDLPGLGVSVWGKSIDGESEVFPLAGIPQPERNGLWHIAVAHGYYVGGGYPFSPSYHITREEIATPGWDYIALGHLPTFHSVSVEPVKAYYSGSPIQYGTVAIVELDDEAGVQVTPYSI